MMEAFESDRVHVIKLLSEEPLKLIETLWGVDSPLAIDRDCRCRLGLYDADQQLRSAYKCIQCTNVGRLTDLTPRLLQAPFAIQCGRYEDLSLIMERFSDIVPMIRLSPWRNQLQLLERLMNREVGSCQPRLREVANLSYIGTDSFTGRLLTGWGMEMTMRQAGLPHFVALTSGFICGNDGFLLREEPLGGLSELFDEEELMEGNNLKEGVAASLLLQLTVALSFMERVLYSSGAPVLSGIRFQDSPCDYTYDDVKVTGPVTLKLLPQEGDSLTIRTSRVFTEDPRDLLHLNNFMPRIERKTVSALNCVPRPNILGSDGRGLNLTRGAQSARATARNRILVCPTETRLTYVLDTKSSKVYHHLRRSGIPLYAASFDLYSFLLSLMCEPRFSNAVRASKRLNDFWNGLWLPQELGLLEGRLAHFTREGAEVTPAEVLELVQGLHLRCGAVSYAWKLLRQL